GIRALRNEGRAQHAVFAGAAGAPGRQSVRSGSPRHHAGAERRGADAGDGTRSARGSPGMTSDGSHVRGHDDDPHDLNRFVRAQDSDYQRALAELRSGRKRSHWIWYIFPQIDGLGFSSTAKQYAIKSLDEAKA